MTLIKKNQYAELHHDRGIYIVNYKGLYTWGFDSASRLFFGDKGKEDAILFFNECTERKTMATPLSQAEQYGAIL